MASEAIVVLSTAPGVEVARELASRIVRERHAACVNLVDGVRSMFWWEGEVQHEAEVLMIIKTAAERLPGLTALLHAHHPYDCPEVVALPIAGGSDAYLKWVTESVARVD